LLTQKQVTSDLSPSIPSKVINRANSEGIHSLLCAVTTSERNVKRLMDCKPLRPSLEILKVIPRAAYVASPLEFGTMTYTVTFCDLFFRRVSIQNFIEEASEVWRTPASLKHLATQEHISIYQFFHAPIFGTGIKSKWFYRL
jgi:hypothetical protein